MAIPSRTKQIEITKKILTNKKSFRFWLTHSWMKILSCARYILIMHAYYNMTGCASHLRPRRNAMEHKLSRASQLAVEAAKKSKSVLHFRHVSIYRFFLSTVVSQFCTCNQCFEKRTFHSIFHVLLWPASVVSALSSGSCTLATTMRNHCARKRFFFVHLAWLLFTLVFSRYRYQTSSKHV